MGTFTGGAIDFAAISTEMRSTILPWMNGTVQIIDPNVDEQTWDPFSNTYTGGEATVLWQGKARIQHLAGTSVPEVGYLQAGIRGIRFQIPMDVNIGFIRKGLQVVVVDGGSDVELEQLSYVITSAINSSYAWGRTIEAEVDVKSVADSTWSSIAGNVVDTELNPIVNATVRTFHHEDNQWLLDYETTTDSLGNYEIPADAGVPIVVSVSHPLYVTEYYDNANNFETATTITPVNHIETENINFELVLD